MITRIKRVINENRQNFTSFIRKLKLRYTTDKIYFEHLKPSIKCKKRWYGSSYGGFYINPDLLTNKSVVYSFGIGKDISFDKKIIRNHGCHVYGFDPTPKSIEFICGGNQNAKFHFEDCGISSETKIEKFYLPVNKHGVSGSMTPNEFVDNNNIIEVKMKSLKDICHSLGHQHIDVLKIDIEGSEYSVLPSILDSGITISQILIEFHDRFFDTEIMSKKSISQLTDRGFKIFAASLNYEEISLINTSLEKDKSIITI